MGGRLEGESNGPAYGAVNDRAADQSGPVLNGWLPGQARGEASGQEVQPGATPDRIAVGANEAGSGARHDGNIQEHRTRAQDNMLQQHTEQQLQQPFQVPHQDPALTPQQQAQNVLRLPEQLHPARPLDDGEVREHSVMETTQGVSMQVMATTNISPPEELPQRQEGMNAGQAVWMVRLGEFLQRRVSQAAAAVAPVLERQQRTPRAFPSPPASWASQMGPEPPLFTPEAESAMQQWTQRAPLLYGWGGQQGPPMPREATSSSGSLTQEQILAEVHRQVQRAMQGHQQEMRALEPKMPDFEQKSKSKAG